MKGTRIVAGLALLVLAFASCGSSLTQEEVENATAVTYAAWMTSALAAGFGQSPEGVTVNEDNTEVTLDNLDISDFEMGYDSVSGTITTDEETVVFDIKMTGGPVSTISYELSADAINSTEFNMDVTANKKSYAVTLDESDFVQ
jgi:hypothetical protein